MPLSLIRNVCKPSACAWPRILTTCILRTMEFRCKFCESHRMPSATVKTGLDSDSGARYSPIKNVVACQVVICMPSCWINRCSSNTPLFPLFRCLYHRSKRIDKYQAGSKVFHFFAQCATNTRSKLPSMRSADRLMKRIDSAILSMSKNGNCC